MAIAELHITGYRSIREIRLPLQQINVLVGPNGCGKSNLFRALYLLTAAANGQLARTLAEEGGMPSVLWAGTRKKGSVRMTLAVELDRLAFELSCGLPPPARSAFTLDPEVKEEKVWFRDGSKSALLLERTNSHVKARDADGNRVSFPQAVTISESVLSELREPERFPALSAVRQEVLGWRFYHRFRTDPDSPLRQPQVGVRTPVLGHDGQDLAAALQTILEIGDHAALHQALERAFPGAGLLTEAAGPLPGVFSVSLRMPEFQRPFTARELSDGTLQYLCLLAALLSPRPPVVIALNEPECSIHSDLLEPLAELIVVAARSSQVWITTHSQELAGFIQKHSGAEAIQLEKVEGETRVARSERKE